MIRDWLPVLRQVLALTVRLDRWRALAIVVLVIVLSGVTAATALSQRWIVDSAGLGSLPGVLLAVLVGTLAFALFSVGFRLQTNLRIELGHHVALYLSKEVSSVASRIPGLAHLELPEYLNRITLVRRGADAIGGAVWALAETAARLASLGLSVWLLASVHPVLTLAAVLAVLPLYLASRGRRLIQRATDETAELERVENELHRLCIEPGPATELRTSGSGELVSDQADAAWAEALRRRTRAHLLAALLQGAGWLGYAAGFAGGLAVVATLALEQRATIGDIMLVVTLASQLSIQMSATVTGITQLGEAGHAIAHYRWLLAYAETHRPRGERCPPERLQTGITLHDVSFRYPGTDREVLSGVNLHLPAGRSIAVVGINGAGKTTLTKLLTGMYKPTSGRIEVDGVALDDIDPAAWRERATGTFQDFMKFQFVLREAVGVGDLSRIADADRIAGAIADAGAGGVVTALPGGLETQLGRTFNGAELSHGQWQRLALSRGNMRTGPLLIVLDEPTAALDPQAEHDLYEAFTRQAGATASMAGTIAVLVSHRFSTVRGADLIMVLEEGRVTETGTHEQLMSSGGTYATHYDVQARGYLSRDTPPDDRSPAEAAAGREGAE